jgi:hypothetical protein
MRNAIVVILVLVAGCLGFTLGRRSTSGQVTALTVAWKTAEDGTARAVEERDLLRKKLADIERDLGSIAKVDLDEYLRLKDADARAEKLSEVLGHYGLRKIATFSRLLRAHGRLAASTAPGAQSARSGAGVGTPKPRTKEGPHDHDAFVADGGCDLGSRRRLQWR